MSNIVSEITSTAYNTIQAGQFLGCAYFTSVSAASGNVAGMTIGLIGMGASALALITNTHDDSQQKKGPVSLAFQDANKINFEAPTMMGVVQKATETIENFTFPQRQTQSVSYKGYRI